MIDLFSTEDPNLDQAALDEWVKDGRNRTIERHEQLQRQASNLAMVACMGEGTKRQNTLAIQYGFDQDILAANLDTDEEADSGTHITTPARFVVGDDSSNVFDSYTHQSRLGIVLHDLDEAIANTTVLDRSQNVDTKLEARL